MERLTQTERLAGHTVHYVEDDNCFDVWGVPKKFMGTAIDRLAAYEDTGLEPEEINAIAGLASENCAKTADKIDQLLAEDSELQAYQDIGTAEEFRALKEAEQMRREGVNKLLNPAGEYAVKFAENHGMSIAEAMEQPMVKARFFFFADTGM